MRCRALRVCPDERPLHGLVNFADGSRCVCCWGVLLPCVDDKATLQQGVALQGALGA